jgi:hypothetical protein
VLASGTKNATSNGVPVVCGVKIADLPSGPQLSPRIIVMKVMQGNKTGHVIDPWSSTALIVFFCYVSRVSGHVNRIFSALRPTAHPATG